MTQQYSKSRDGARQHLKGLDAPILPSFTPDMPDLDEEGIRYDVNHLIANGMTSILTAPGSCGHTLEERKRFVEIVCDEPRGRVHPPSR